MKAKDNVKMIGHLGGAVMKIGRMKKATEGKITGHLGEKMQHKVKERLVYDGLKARVVDVLPEQPFSKRQREAERSESNP